MTLFKAFLAIKEQIKCFTGPYSQYVYKYRKSTRNRALVLIEYQECSGDNA